MDEYVPKCKYTDLGFRKLELKPNMNRYLR